jgi:hypothetical protein
MLTHVPTPNGIRGGSGHVCADRSNRGGGGTMVEGFAVEPPRVADVVNRSEAMAQCCYVAP